MPTHTVPADVFAESNALAGQPGPADEEDESKSENDSDDNEDASSEVSEGVDLKADLGEILENDFDFQGSYAYAKESLDAPNPCLYIEGIGLIGLPLSVHYAQLIAGLASQAPFGRGSQTVVDTAVRHTWELEPSKLRFGNAAWEPFIRDYVVNTVCPALGAATTETHLKVELYKLLLYETGSHFLPHQDSQKAAGMFATVVVVLPSHYTGGELHVSHGGSSKVFDFASSSLLSTSLLAWYTDVVHSVSPITSGYRLALTYNLIQSSTTTSLPSIPSMDGAVADARHLMRKWRMDAYADAPEMLSYVLEHKYSPASIREGIVSLKGRDAHMVRHLRGVAEEQGFVIGLANLTFHQNGCPDNEPEYGWSGYKRRRYRHYYDSEEDDQDADEDGGGLTMDEIIDSSMKLENLTDLDGTSLLGSQSMYITEDDIIPENYFEGEDPDERNYEGYMGNWGPTLDFYYHRSVMAIYRKDKEMKILFSVGGGVSYAMGRLKASNAIQPTSEERELARLVVPKLVYPSDKQTMITLLEYAERWNDIGIWKQLARKCVGTSSMDVLNQERLSTACSKFSFAALRPIFEELLETRQTLKQRIDFIQMLTRSASDSEKETAANWNRDQTTRSLGALKTAYVEDIPLLMSIRRSKGDLYFDDAILPQLQKPDTSFSFWNAFIMSLRATKQDDDYSLAARCLGSVITQWEIIASSQNYSSKPQKDRVSRITAIIDLCLAMGSVDGCTKVLRRLLHLSGSTADRFRSLYTPLIPELRIVLAKHSRDITSPPFQEFGQQLVALYLRKILGIKPRNASRPARKLGCGCPHCHAMDKFLSSDKPTLQYAAAQTHRTHLEQQMRQGQDLVTWTTVRSGSPYTLVITKTAEALATSQWDAKRRAAKAFLLSLGDAEVLKRLMGARWDDVYRALSGEKAYARTHDVVAPPQDSAPRAATSTRDTRLQDIQNAVDAQSTSRAAAAEQVPAQALLNKGTKRKSVAAPGPIIDLTLDED